ncbi:uncharacterized protein [Onthophagus taurus]|uniref:uncharacterized protein isoform X2 n=1 Tax=Onthophagus taurus TaxID=166361 RepID=UPI0039BDE73D
MILIVLGCLSILNNANSEWIQIPQPKGDAVSEVFDTTESNKYTTFATTQHYTTDSDYFLNQTETSMFSKRIDSEFLYDDIKEERFQFPNYIEDVQDNLLKHNHGSFKSKLNILLDLKNNLLYNIKNKINRLWPIKPEGRQAKHLEKEDDYHMDFPSNEGALMTIGFLTFAVFLIKLVLKLITTLRDKNNVMTTTAAPGTVLFGKKKRDVAYEEEIRILRHINEFKYQ